MRKTTRNMQPVISNLGKEGSKVRTRYKTMILAAEFYMRIRYANAARAMRYTVTPLPDAQPRMERYFDGLRFLP
jgi:hypothetical protein